jgi:hypothetical protein
MKYGLPRYFQENTLEFAEKFFERRVVMLSLSTSNCRPPGRVLHLHRDHPLKLQILIALSRNGNYLVQETARIWP